MEQGDKIKQNQSPPRTHTHKTPPIQKKGEENNNNKNME